MTSCTTHTACVLILLFCCTVAFADNTTELSSTNAGSIQPLTPSGLYAAWLVPSDSSRSSVRIEVLSGERDNTDAPGLAHYAEHLAWLSAIDDQPGEVGRHSNAWTNDWVTVYLLEGQADELEAMIATLARVLDPVTLPEEFTTQERDIVQRNTTTATRNLQATR